MSRQAERRGFEFEIWPFLVLDLPSAAAFDDFLQPSLLEDFVLQVTPTSR